MVMNKTGFLVSAQLGVVVMLMDMILQHAMESCSERIVRYWMLLCMWWWMFVLSK